LRYKNCVIHNNTLMNEYLIMQILDANNFKDEKYISLKK